MKRNEGMFFWFRWFVLLAICFMYFWLWGWVGVIPGVLVAIAATVTGNVFREMYCTVKVHPNGLHGYNASKELLGKCYKEGPAGHKMARDFWGIRFHAFLYSENGKRWSWRPYALLVVLALIGYLSTLFLVALILLFVSIALSVVNNAVFAPLSLFLGSSSPEARRILIKIGRISGIKWASLLRDTIQLDDEPSKSDASMYLLDYSLLPNIWSLRMEEADNWRQTVGDFIRASAIIVLWPDINDAVQEEIDALSRAEYLERVIVIRTDSEVEERLPEPLRKCLMSEQEAMDLIALTASNPRLFRKQLWGRFDR